MNNLIINDIDHSVFDLEWAKRGGVVYHYGDFCRYICDGDNHNEIRAGQDGEHLIGVEKTVGLISILTIEKVENIPYYMRMATPAECAEAGIEYIEPPARWFPAERAPRHTVLRLYYDGSVSVGWIYCDGEDSAGKDVRAWQPLPLPPKDE